jgi:dTMP kinase
VSEDKNFSVLFPEPVTGDIMSTPRPQNGALFISFEGGEGCGKTTQLKLLEDKLKTKGIDAIFTREPGGTKNGEEIRTMLLTGDTDKWTPEEELMLHSAARSKHVRTVIRPALDAGKWVISDRFADSTTVYQGYVQGVNMANVASMHKAAVGEHGWPDLTILLDIPVDVGLGRKNVQADEGLDETRYENHGVSFHAKVRAGFLDLAKASSGRVVVVDAVGSIEEVQQRIWQTIEAARKKLKAS